MLEQCREISIDKFSFDVTDNKSVDKESNHSQTNRTMLIAPELQCKCKKSHRDFT